MCPLGTLLVIITILVLIAIFYFTTSYHYYDVKPVLGVKTDRLNKDDEQTIFGKEEKTQISIVSNFSDGIIHNRVMNLMIIKGNYYIYSNKDNHHVKQLQKDNRVSILTYLKEGSVYTQKQLYGTLDEINEIENLIIYKLSIQHRKASITYENGPIQKTKYTFDGREGLETNTDLRNVVDAIRLIKSMDS